MKQINMIDDDIQEVLDFKRNRENEEFVNLLQKGRCENKHLIFITPNINVR